LVCEGFVLPVQNPRDGPMSRPLLAQCQGASFFLIGAVMENEIILPAVWLAEAKSAYAQYVMEWRMEERAAAAAENREPEPVQPWREFLREYLYAELEQCTMT